MIRLKISICMVSANHKVGMICPSYPGGGQLEELRTSLLWSVMEEEHSER